MKVPINLASQPFRRDRTLIVASLAVAALLVVSLGALVALAISDRNQMGDVRRDITRLNRQIREATRAKSESDAVLRQPANAEVLERSIFINALLYRKGISWTRLLADLEKTLPHNVRVLQIRPFVTGKGQITLDLMVGAEGPDAVIGLYKKVEESPLFGGLTPVSNQPPTQAEPLYRYRVTVSYAQKL
jgi:type IV pilus assembly protein PilN